MNNLLSTCPACGIKYEVGPMGHRTFYTSFQPSTPTSPEFVYTKICRYAKKPGCVNLNNDSIHLPSSEGYINLADEILNDLNERNQQ